MQVPSQAGRDASGRRVPVRAYDQMIAPPDDMPELARAFALLCSLRDGRIPAREVAAAVKHAGLTAQLDRYRSLSAELAEAFAIQLANIAQRRAELSRPAPAVLRGGEAAAASAAEEITPGDAADQFGRTPRRWQQLAQEKKVASRPGPRNTLRLSLADVIAYDRKRRGRGTGGGEGPRGSAGDAGGSPGGSGAAGGTAA